MFLKRKSAEEKARSKELNKMTFWILWNSGLLPAFIVMGVVLAIIIVGLWNI